MRSVAGNLRTELICHMAGGIANLNQLMGRALRRRNVMRTERDTDCAVAARVECTSVGRQKPAVTADRDFNEIRRLLERFILQALMHQVHDLLPHDNRGIGVGIRQHDLFRVIVAAPDDAGIIRRIACKPAVEITRGRAGLAGDGHVLQLRRRAGALLDSRFEHIGDIPRGHVLHGNVGFLRVIQNDLPVRVLHNGVSPGFAPNALVCERGISRCHSADGYAPCEAAESKRPEVHIGQFFAVCGLIRGNKCGKSHFILGEGIAVFRRHFRHKLDRDGIDRLLDSLLHGDKAAVGRIEVFGPCRRISEGIRRIVHDGRRRNQTEFNGGCVDCNRFDDGTRRQEASRRTVPDEASLLFPDTTCQRNNITGRIVNNDNAGLQLL